jgi:hypothetical protein
MAWTFFTGPYVLRRIVCPGLRQTAAAYGLEVVQRTEAGTSSVWEEGRTGFQDYIDVYTELRTTAIVSSSTYQWRRPGEYWIANAHVASRTERRRTTFFHRLAFGGVHERLN